MARRQDTALQALGDPTRRGIVAILRRGAQPVGEIARRLPVSRPAVSKHIRVLERARLVRTQPRGASTICSLDPAGFSSLRAYFDLMWETALDQFKVIAERSGGTRS